MYNSPDLVRIASGDPARTHWSMHFRLSASLATEAFLLRKRQALSRTNPTIVPGVPIMSGGIGSGLCACHSRATLKVPVTIIVLSAILDIVRVSPYENVDSCPTDSYRHTLRPDTIGMVQRNMKHGCWRQVFNG